jgi:hypothetical protein
MVLDDDMEASPQEALGLWHLMDDTGDAANFHTSRRIARSMPIGRCNRRNGRHIRVPGLWFLRPRILQGETPDWERQRLEDGLKSPIESVE